MFHRYNRRANGNFAVGADANMGVEVVPEGARAPGSFPEIPQGAGSVWSLVIFDQNLRSVFGEGIL